MDTSSAHRTKEEHMLLRVQRGAEANLDGTAVSKKHKETAGAETVVWLGQGRKEAKTRQG